MPKSQIGTLIILQSMFLCGAAAAIDILASSFVWIAFDMPDYGFRNEEDVVFCLVTFSFIGMVFGILHGVYVLLLGFLGFHISKPWLFIRITLYTISFFSIVVNIVVFYHQKLPIFSPMIVTLFLLVLLPWCFLKRSPRNAKVEAKGQETQA